MPDTSTNLVNNTGKASSAHVSVEGARVFASTMKNSKIPWIMGALGGCIIALTVAVWKIENDRQRLIQDVDAKSALLAEAQAQATDDTHNLALLRTRISGVQSALDLLKKQTDDQKLLYTKQTDLLQHQLDAEAADRQRREAELSDLVKTKADLQAQLQQVAARTKELEEQLQKEKSGRGQAELDEANLKKMTQGEDDQLKKDKALLDKALKDAKDKDAQLKKAQTDAAKQISDLQDQLRREKDALDKANQEIKNLEAQRRRRP